MIVISRLTVVGRLGWSWLDLTFVLAFTLHEEWCVKIDSITLYLVHARYTRVVIFPQDIILSPSLPSLVVFGVSLSVYALSLVFLLIFSPTKNSVDFRLSKVIAYKL